MNKRMAYLSMLTLAAVVASILGGAAMAKSLAAPTVTSMSPTSGARGTAVTITGANLQNATVTWTIAGKPGASGSTSGSMKAAPITVTVSPDGTKIMFNVPDGGDTSNGIMAAGGANRITITTPGGSVSKLFSVTTTNTLGLRPAITHLMPKHAAHGAQIVIFGSHFTGTTSVMLGGMKAKYTVPSDTKILATVPMKAHSGFWTVKTRYGTVKSPAFTVSGAAT